MRRSLALLLMAAVLAGCSSAPTATPLETAKPLELKGQLYVALGESNRIAAIDLQEQKLSELITVGQNNHGLALVPGGRLFMPSSDEGGGVAVLDPQNLSVQHELPLNPKGHHAAADPMGRYLYITTSPDTLTVLDAVTHQTIKVLPTGEGSYYVAAQPEANHVTMDPGGKAAYVTLTGSKEIVILDTNTRQVVGRIPVGYPPHQMVVAPAGTPAAAGASAPAASGSSSGAVPPLGEQPVDNQHAAHHG